MKFVVWAVAGVIGAGAFGGGLSEAEFRNPPIAYGPHVWWHWVNGVYAPVIAWRPPYEADITAGAAASRDGRVELEVEVVNTWVNRLIGDQLRFGPVGAYSGDDVVVRIPDWVRADEAPQAAVRCCLPRAQTNFRPTAAGKFDTIRTEPLDGL